MPIVEWWKRRFFETVDGGGTDELIPLEMGGNTQKRDIFGYDLFDGWSGWGVVGEDLLDDFGYIFKLLAEYGVDSVVWLHLGVASYHFVVVGKCGHLC